MGQRKNPPSLVVVSSYLRELKALKWRFRKVGHIVRDQKVEVYTDSQSAYAKLTSPSTWYKKTDPRLLQVYNFLLGNYSVGRSFKVQFVEGKTNMIAGLLSHWKTYVNQGSIVCAVEGGLIEEHKGMMEKAHEGH